MYKIVFWKWRITRNGRSDLWVNTHSVIKIELDPLPVIGYIADQLYRDESSQFVTDRFTRFEWELLEKAPAGYVTADMLKNYEKAVYKASIELQLLLENS